MRFSIFLSVLSLCVTDAPFFSSKPKGCADPTQALSAEVARGCDSGAHLHLLQLKAGVDRYANQVPMRGRALRPLFLIITPICLHVLTTPRRPRPGVPIVAANMDTTGTFETAAVMGKHKLLTAASKHYSAEEWAAQPAEVSWA